MTGGILSRNDPSTKNNNSSEVIGAGDVRSADHILQATLKENPDLALQQYFIPVDYDTYVEWAQQFKEGISMAP